MSESYGLLYKNRPDYDDLLYQCVANSQVPVNLNNYLYPVESDESMLETYMAALTSETLK